ncbi:hypothetical protein LNQ52_03780 [Klebsiella pneumoniae subsp. pneumoniae]|nr:hypothetical protein [Klebsiella pneumoniae subsp. pneumoniae]
MADNGLERRGTGLDHLTGDNIGIDNLNPCCAKASATVLLPLPIPPVNATVYPISSDPETDCSYFLQADSDDWQRAGEATVSMS